MNWKLETKPRAVWLGAAMLLGCASFALAQGAPGAPQGAARGANVVPQLSAFKVVATDKGEALASASKVGPGEIIEYQVNYANTGGRPARNLQATLPIPGALVLVPGSARPAGAQASLNGKDYAPLPLMRTVKAPDGTSRTVPVPLSEYRFLRWNVAALDAGKSVRVAARVQLPALLKTAR